MNEQHENPVYRAQAAVGALCCVLLVFAARSVAEDVQPAAEAPVGIEQIVQVRWADTKLTTIPITEESPIVVRIARVQPGEDGRIYHFGLIGLEPGDYELKDYVRDEFDKPVADFPDLTFRVNSLLAPDHDGKLIQLPRSPMEPLGGYRRLLSILTGVWILWLIAILFVGRREKEEEEVEEEAPPPSIADLLRPLVIKAMQNTISTAEKARLDSLLLCYWREKLQLQEMSMAECLAHMRKEPEAAGLLQGLETWLYSPPGRGEVDLEALLTPYRDIPADALTNQEVSA